MAKWLGVWDVEQDEEDQSQDTEFQFCQRNESSKGMHSMGLYATGQLSVGFCQEGRFPLF